MSLSYGITNFVLIWTWISKDENAREWTLFILLWWFVCPLLTDALGNGDVIKIQRTTGAYHGWMPVQYFPKRQKPPFSSPPPVSDWSFRPIRLGAFSADRRHTQRGNRVCGRQADGIACQFVVGDQSRHAADLYYIPADNLCFYGRP